jgi:hypothetical protein
MPKLRMLTDDIDAQAHRIREAVQYTDFQPGKKKLQLYGKGAHEADAEGEEEDDEEEGEGVTEGNTEGSNTEGGNTEGANNSVNNSDSNGESSSKSDKDGAEDQAGAAAMTKGGEEMEKLADDKEQGEAEEKAEGKANAEPPTPPFEKDAAKMKDAGVREMLWKGKTKREMRGY